MNIIPSFETDRLILKEVSILDVPSYSKYFVDYEVVKFLSSVVPWPYPENGVEEYLETFVFPKQGKIKWVWGIFLKANPDELIGCIDLWRDGIPENRGFWLGKQFWGQGIMTEAVYPTLDYAFDILNFDKLVFSNALGNISSRKIKEKTGCKLIEISPAKFVNPDFTERELWELKKEDWKKFTETNKSTYITH